MPCPLCSPINEQRLWQNKQIRVITVDDHPHAPAFCRVIWHEHIAEMTDLSHQNRHDLMEVVYAVEHAMRSVFTPSKINLASLGNQVPHLHWHVIARFAEDVYFPDTVWHSAKNSHKIIRLPENWQAQLTEYLNRVLR